MKFKYILISVLILFFQSCKHENKVKVENKLSIFYSLPPGRKDRVELYINNKKIYTGKFIYGKNSSFYNDMLIAKINKDSLNLKFKIRIGDKDTSFMYNINGIDSIVFSLDDKLHIVTNHDSIAWIKD